MARDVKEAERVAREAQETLAKAGLATRPGASPASEARGGFGTFVLGALMTLLGAGLLVSRLVVSSGFGALYGFNPTGPALLALLVGFVFLFRSAKSVVGWGLVGLSFVTILVSAVLSMRVWFAPTPPPVVVGIFVLLGGGLGLVLRAMRA